MSLGRVGSKGADNQSRSSASLWEILDLAHFLHKYSLQASSGLGLGLRTGDMTVNLESIHSLKNVYAETPKLGAEILWWISNPFVPLFLSSRHTIYQVSTMYPAPSRLQIRQQIWKMRSNFLSQLSLLAMHSKPGFRRQADA